jgi:hypothetical protein
MARLFQAEARGFRNLTVAHQFGFILNTICGWLIFSFQTQRAA